MWKPIRLSKSFFKLKEVGDLSNVDGVVEIGADVLDQVMGFGDASEQRMVNTG